MTAQTSTLADLTAATRRTTGQRPPPLVRSLALSLSLSPRSGSSLSRYQVGCSLTLINDHIYLFGGRLVPTRTMVSTLYSLSLRTLEWQLLWPPTTTSTAEASTPAPVGPAARYFHSAEAWGHKIVIFGGEGYAESEGGGTADGQGEGEGGDEEEEEDQAPLCTLGDLCIWDTEKRTWEFPSPECEEGVEPPAPRYAHLGVVSTVVDEKEVEKSVMLLMGGQDIRNTCEWLPRLSSQPLCEADPPPSRGS